MHQQHEEAAERIAALFRGAHARCVVDEDAMVDYICASSTIRGAQSLHHHCTITVSEISYLAPSLHHHCTITTCSAATVLTLEAGLQVGETGEVVVQGSAVSQAVWKGAGVKLR